MCPTNNLIYSFAKRLRYIPNKNLSNDIIVDHVNKEYNTNLNPYYILFDIIFWNTPSFIYNVVKLSFKNSFGYNMTLNSLVETVKNLNLQFNSIKYRNSNLYKILHPCIDSSLRNNFNKVIHILLCKSFDKEDNYFNVFPKEITNNKLIDVLNKDQYEFLFNVSKLDIIISGSFAMSMYGYISRTNIKDFDLCVDSKYLPNNILKLVDKEVTYNKIVGKNRIKVEQEVKDEFITCEFYNKLSKLFNNKLEIISAVIDRVAEYDKLVRVAFIIKYKDIEFDLIFRTSTNYDEFYIFPNNKIKLQNINDILYTKRLLGRPKDFQDLINFKPYIKLNNDGKYKIKYE